MLFIFDNLNKKNEILRLIKAILKIITMNIIYIS